MKKILIIDDEHSKAQKAQETLEAIYAGEEITFWNVGTYEEGTWEIEAGGYDLLVLDMSFPRKSGERQDLKMGIRVLDYMEAQKIHLPTIVSSSDPHRIIDDNVLGCVQFNYMINLREEFERCLRRL